MIKEAVILAAGRARRLSPITGGRPKFLLEIEGKPLIYYTFSMLKLYNVERVHIVVSSSWYNEAVFTFSQFKFPFEINVVENDSVDRENGYSFLLTEHHIQNDSFLLMMSDHIFSKDLLDAFVSSVSNNFEDAILLVGGDSDPKFVDINEATKILADSENKILDIGKQLRDFNYVDMGLFYVRKNIFQYVNSLSEKYVIKFSEIVKRLSNVHKAVVVDLSNTMWTELDTPEDYYDLLNGQRRVILENILKFIS